MAVIKNLLSQGIVEKLGWTLIHFVWQAAVVAVLLAAVLRLLRRRNADTRYIAGCAALALMVALPIATITFVEASGPGAEVGPAPAKASAADTTPTSEIVEVAELPPLSPDEAAPLETAPLPRPAWHEKLVGTFEPALPYIVCAWLLGVFGLSAWHLGGWTQLQRLKRRMVCEVAPELQAKLALLAQSVGVQRVVTLLESALVEVPTVVGWVKPVILLPASALTGLTAEQLETVLAHELAHIRRYDYLVNMLQTIVEILGFYHPAVWSVSRRIRIERENCCDDVAVHVCGDSLRYARALTHLEEMRVRGRELAVAATGGSLIARIGRLLGRPTANERRFAWLPGLVALLLVAGLAIPAALVLGAAEPVELSQARAHALLQEMIEANRYWLIGPGPEIKDYSYDFSLHVSSASPDPAEPVKPVRITVADPRTADSRQRKGICYHWVLHEVAQNPANVRITSAVDEGQLIRLDLEFADRVALEHGNKMTGLRQGIGGVGAKVKEARLWLDPEKRIPVKTEWRHDQSSIEGVYSEYVRVAGGQNVPLQVDFIHVGPQFEEQPWIPDHHYHNFKFSFFEPGLWLFDQSRMTQGASDRVLRDMPLVASTSDIMINGVPRTKTGPQVTSSTTALRAQLEELAHRERAASGLSGLGRTLRVYAGSSGGGRYPPSLAALDEFVSDALPEWSAWTHENVTYLGQGQRVGAPDDTPIAYDKTLLAEQGGTNVLFNDTHVSFVTRQELEQLGIFPDAELPDAPLPTRVKKSKQPKLDSYGQSQVEIDLLAAEVFSDVRLDYETATLVRDLLAEALTAAAKAAGRPASIPTVEELQLPLRRIIRDYVVALKLTGNEVKALVDLLVPRGYAKVVARPTIRAVEGEEIEMVIGDTPETEEQTPRFNLHATVTPYVAERGDTIRMETEWHFRHPIVMRQGNEDVERGSGAASETGIYASIHGPRLITRNAEYAGLYKLLEREDEQGRWRVPLVLLKPTIMPAGTSQPAQEAVGGPKPPRPAQVWVATASDDPTAGEKAHVLIDCKTVEVSADTRLDRETALALGGILEAPIQLEDDTGRSQATLGAILAEHVARHTLPDETVQALLHLLHSRDCMKFLAAPQVLTRDGEKTQVNIITEEFYMVTPRGAGQNAALSEPKLEKIETGTKLAITPHIPDENDNIVLETSLELCDALPRASGNDLPVVTRRAVTTTLAIAPGEYIAIPIETEDKETLYVMLRALIVKPAATESVSLPEEPGDSQREPVNADPLVQELAKGIAQTERDLIVAQQKLASQHPEVVQKKNLLHALNERLEARRKELQQQSTDHVVTTPRHILLDFTVAEISADKRLSPEAARQVSALLSATAGDRSPAVAARPEALERCSVEYLLQNLNDKVSNETYEGLLDALKSHGYMKPLSAPHMIVAEGERAKFIISDLLELGVIAETMKDRSTVQMDISLDLKLIEELPLPEGYSEELQAPPTPVRSLQTQTVLAVAERRYAVLELGGVRENPGENANCEAFYLFVKPEIVRPQPNGG